MFLIYKNKGLLIVLYLIVSFIGTATLAGAIGRQLGVKFAVIYTSIGIALIIAGIWTYLTKDDYYKDRNGNKKKLETVSELFFMSMKTWSIILISIGVILVLNLVFKYFPPIS